MLRIEELSFTLGASRNWTRDQLEENPREAMMRTSGLSLIYLRNLCFLVLNLALRKCPLKYTAIEISHV